MPHRKPREGFVVTRRGVSDALPSEPLREFRRLQRQTMAGCLLLLAGLVLLLLASTRVRFELGPSRTGLKR